VVSAETGGKPTRSVRQAHHPFHSPPVFMCPGCLPPRAGFLGLGDLAGEDGTLGEDKALEQYDGGRHLEA
jgi:hypothetical protein